MQDYYDKFCTPGGISPSGVLRVLLEIVQQTLRARKHSDKQYEALGELLGLYGYVQSRYRMDEN